MIFVFESGRILFTEAMLRPQDKGKYVAVAKLPYVTAGPDQQIIYRADLAQQKVVTEVIDIPPVTYTEEEVETQGLDKSTMVQNEVGDWELHYEPDLSFGGYAEPI